MTNTHVKKNIGNQSKNDLGDRIREIRVSKMRTDQKGFARLLGVSQAVVSQWEGGKFRPSAMALVAIAKLAGDGAEWWYEQAGEDYATVARGVATYKKTHRVDEEENRTVLIYGEVGTGPFRFVPEEAVDKVSVPRSWFPPSAHVVGLITKGDSMSPLIRSGYIVLVDLHQRSTSDLSGKIVVVSDGEGLTVKWLQKVGKGYLLAPQNLNVENPIVAVKSHHKVIGKVERWISGETK